MFKYSFIVMGLVFWHNRAYKRSVFLISVAGMLNPTIMSIGIIMIIEYLANILKDRKADEAFFSYAKRNLLSIVLYGSCYIVGVIPLFYNIYNVGHINLTASYSGFIHDKESIISRFWSYLFDLNYGILPYFCPVFVLAIFLVFSAILNGHKKYLQWIFAFFLNTFLYSIMVHINSGMSGIARYNSWGVAILLFSVCLYFGELIQKVRLETIAMIMLSLSVVFTGIVVYQYGPYQASNTSYVNMTPIASFILDKTPQLYNPLHSTFSSRTIHVDGGYMYNTPVVYVAKDGYVRKILAPKEDITNLLDYYASLSGHDKWYLNQLNKLNDEEQYILVPVKYKILKFNDYELGSPIWFYTDNFNTDCYVSTGLSGTESWGTWTSRGELQMPLKISSEVTSMHGHIDCIAFNNQQTVLIYVNNKIVNNLVYRGGGIDFENSEKSGFINIKIELPEANSPYALGQSDDRRILGLGIQKIVITE